jgi:hypothetical protein
MPGTKKMLGVIQKLTRIHTFFNVVVASEEQESKKNTYYQTHYL